MQETVRRTAGQRTGPDLLRTRFLSMCAFLLSMAAAGSAAMEQWSLLQILNGRWRGDGIEIGLDTGRLQANTDPGRPFDWQALRVRNITGNLILFEIGKQDYVGLVAADSMALTSSAFDGPKTLKHISDVP